jgi:hypothetical protein
MTELRLRLRHGPDGQPAGSLRRESGQVVTFLGWLALIRALEDELRGASESDDPADPSSDG